jgi:hypothetical protein
LDKNVRMPIEDQKKCIDGILCSELIVHPSIHVLADYRLFNDQWYYYEQLYLNGGLSVILQPP